MIVLFGILALSTLTREVDPAIDRLLNLLEDRIGHVERIETSLGVDLQDAGVVVGEDIARHLTPIDETWLLLGLAILVLLGVGSIKLFIEEAPAAEGVAELHVDHAPGRQHGLLVGVVEIREDGGNLRDAVLGVERVGLLHHLTDALGGTGEDAAVEAVLEDVEGVLGEAEMVAELVGGEGVEAGVGLLDELVEKTLDGGLMHKTVDMNLIQLRLQLSPLQDIGLAIDKRLEPSLVVLGPHAEELMEAEVLLVLDSLVAKHLVEGEGENLHAWQVGIGIGVAKVVLVPIEFGPLLHDIVPGVDLALVVLVEEVEGRAREGEDAGIGFLQLRHDAHASLGLDALVGLIDHDKVPVVLHDGFLQWVEMLLLATYELREAEVLHGDEEHQNLLALVHIAGQTVEVALPLVAVGVLERFLGQTIPRGKVIIFDMLVDDTQLAV